MEFASDGADIEDVSFGISIWSSDALMRGHFLLVTFVAMSPFQMANC